MSKMYGSASAVTMCLALGMAAGSANAITYGQTDTFPSGNTQGWHDGGSATPPEVITGGGPAGSADSFLQLVATGASGAGSRLAVISGASWLGNYTAAGVTAIALDAINRGPTALDLRLYFQGTGGAALSTVALTLPVRTTWTHLIFPVTAAALTGPNVAATLANVTEMRVFHNATATFPPSPVQATIGLDNIAAVPEPSTLGLWAAGVGVVALSAARRRVRAQAQAC